MSFRNSTLDPRTRRLIAFGMLCLVVGLLLFGFVHPAGQTEKNWLHFACGLFLGISITINLFALRLSRRCREKQIAAGSPQ